MIARSALRSLSLLSLFAAIGCAAPSPTDEAAAAESGWTAVPGAHQARLRAISGEEIVLAFDPVKKIDPRRPECTLTVADPLRVRVYDRTSTEDAMQAKVDSFVRGRTVAFGRDEATSPGEITLARVSAVAFGADLPDFVLAKRCSGEPLDFAQRWEFSSGGEPLLDPIGDERTFWTNLALAGRSGVSAIAEHAVDLQATDGTKVQLAFRKLRGDDPASPETCERTEAVPLRLTVETSAPASEVKVDLENTWRARTTASVADPTAPRGTVLSKEGPTKFAVDLGALTIDARCSGEPKTYGQKLVVSVDGRPLVDPVGQKPFFLTNLAAAPGR